MSISVSPSDMFVIDSDNHLWKSTVTLCSSGHVRLQIEENEKELKYEQVSCGFENVLLVADHGRLYVQGKNRKGELGIEYTRSITQWTSIDYLPQIISICCSNNNFSLLLDKEGIVWSSGRNKSGQLGLGDKNNRDRFTEVPNLPKITQITTGMFHSLALDESGMVWGTGGNSFGQLGMKEKQVHTFCPLPDLPRITKVSTCANHTLLLDEEHRLWACGLNGGYQLGHSDKTFIRTFCTYEELPPINNISAGSEHSFVLDCDCQVWAVGSNVSGQLGIGGSVCKVQQWTKVQTLPYIMGIFATYSYSLFVDQGGSLWYCGKGTDVGSVFVPTKIITSKPLHVPLLKSNRQKSARK